ncbi:phospholipase A2 inhibitor isoform X2 [Condylostylus longicornis]|uniref:phospholipase A2 inhibitor isoform X2 n=1 Tax=Condylostylus longicornis TaxID=2530218 RepID=UPI00244DA893|nr:phospholipase A2 inhibitor isoform X2 [Condylostylus longicornis]
MNEVAINILVTLLTSYIFPTAFAGDCGSNFKAKCTCGEMPYDGILQYVVNCTNAGFTNTNILESMPNETQILIFSGNRIDELPWNVFGTINKYYKLTVVDMSNNHIREIRGKAYHHVQNVKRLILDHNNLSISRDDDDVNHHHPRVFSNFINLEALHLTDAFADNSPPELSEDLHDIFFQSNLTKLRKLHLEQNEISTFKDRKVFCDLINLNDLYLGDNWLQEINFDVKCLKKLRFLDLERNKFEYLKPKDLKLLDELEENSRMERSIDLIVDFKLNPFVCDCKIHQFHKWLNLTKVNVREKEKLVCLKDGRNLERISQIQYDKSLSIILVGLLSALAYLSRDKIRHAMFPVLDTMSKKVQYTTIKDDDCPEVHV